MSESLSVTGNTVPLASIDETDDLSTATVQNSSHIELQHIGGNYGGHLNPQQQQQLLHTQPFVADKPKWLYQNANFDSCHSFSSSIFSPAGGEAPEFVNSNEPVPPTKSTFTPDVNFVQHDEDFGDTGFFSSSSISFSSKQSSIDFSSIQRHGDEEEDDDDEEEAMIEKILYDNDNSANDTPTTPFNSLVDQSAALSSNSLENLVNNFDENVKTCLKDFEKNVAELAPVQMRCEDEVISQRPAWWTLTGEYGNILPIDWSNLAQQSLSEPYSGMNSLISLEDANCNVQQILNDIQNNAISTKSAEEVLEEIETILSNSESLCSESLCEVRQDLSVKPISFYRFSLEKLKNLQLDQLQDLCEDLEVRTQDYSQQLIRELALRDECEFEKETKSSFIDLLIQMHNSRRELIEADFSRPKSLDSCRKRMPPIITTTIPYPSGSVANNIPVLQALNKLMKSMLEDNPAIPTLLTDYILKHVCPTDRSVEPTSSLGESAQRIYKSVHRNSLRLINRS